MATRRPQVPRATPAAPKSPDAGDGGDVIQADFGSRGAAAGKAAAGNPAIGKSAGLSSSAAKAAGRAAVDARAAGKPQAGSGTGASSAQRKSAPKHGPDGPEESLDPVPAKAFSGRMLALGVVMVAVTILLAPSVKIFLDKRAEIAALQADISAKEATQDDLKRQVSRWQDPNYVKQQARDRINMVMPGETGYWVFGSDLPAGTASGPAGTGSAQDPVNLPWVDALWESIRRSATD